MASWQERLLEELRTVPGLEVEPYGSVVRDEDLDGWSDLDVRLRLSFPAAAETLFDARLWAWQESVDDAGQHLRCVFADGRWVDAAVTGGHRLALPEPPRDNAIRLEGALAAVRLGRGSDLVGLHLVFGILRETLVQVMLTADRDLETNHHRLRTPYDSRAAGAAAVAARPLRPAMALEACELYARWRQEVEPGYRGDWSGLRAVIGRGEGC